MRKKWKVQDVHDDEQQEIIEQTAQQEKGTQETKLREDINLRERRTISKTPTTRPLQKTTLA